MPLYAMQRLFDHLDERLVATLRLQLDISHTLRAQLAEDVTAECWCSHVCEDTMTVTVTDGNFASLIHYQQRELLKRINADFKDQLECPLRQIKVQVAAHRKIQG